MLSQSIKPLEPLLGRFRSRSQLASRTKCLYFHQMHFLNQLKGKIAVKIFMIKLYWSYFADMFDALTYAQFDTIQINLFFILGIGAQLGII